MDTEKKVNCKILIRTWRVLMKYLELECTENSFELIVTKTKSGETYAINSSYITRTPNLITISGFDTMAILRLILRIQNSLVEGNLSSWVSEGRDINYININQGIALQLYEEDIFHLPFLK